MKYLLLLLVVGIGVWMLMARNRKPGQPPAKPDQPARPGSSAAPDARLMLQCVHCGVHLPAADAVTDAAGQAFCSEAHRLAGPR